MRREISSAVVYKDDPKGVPATVVTFIFAAGGYTYRHVVIDFNGVAISPIEFTVTAVLSGLATSLLQ